jgi:hypothetical protein
MTPHGLCILSRMQLMAKALKTFNVFSHHFNLVYLVFPYCDVYMNIEFVLPSLERDYLE